MTNEQRAALIRILTIIVQSDDAEVHHNDTWLVSQILKEPMEASNSTRVLIPLTKEMIQDIMDHTKPVGIFKTYNYYTEWFTKFTTYVEGLHAPKQG